MNQQREHKDRPPPQWVAVKPFKDEKTGITARVLRDKSSKMPKFALEVGKDIGKDNSFGERIIGKRIPVFVDRHEGKAQLRDDISSIVGSLTAQAEAWIRNEAQRLEDEFHRQREQERFDRHEPRQKVMRQGKTDRKRRRRAEKRAAKEAPE